MKVLIACEFSGIVRDAFIAKGHNAISCDYYTSERPGPHIHGKVEQVLDDEWDMMIAFPPCTYLTRAGAWLWKERSFLMLEAASFVRLLANAAIERIAIENPIGRLNQLWRYPDQTIQPWQFGEPVTKATCLWLKNLPKLTPTNIVTPRKGWITEQSPSPERWMIRSRTFQGIANAMAEQWG